MKLSNSENQKLEHLENHIKHTSVVRWSVTVNFFNLSPNICNQMIEMVSVNMKSKHHDFHTKWKTKTKTCKHQNVLTYRRRWGRSKVTDFRKHSNRLGIHDTNLEMTVLKELGFEWYKFVNDCVGRDRVQNDTNLGLSVLGKLVSIDGFGNRTKWEQKWNDRNERFQFRNKMGTKMDLLWSLVVSV